MGGGTQATLPARPMEEVANKLLPMLDFKVIKRPSPDLPLYGPASGYHYYTPDLHSALELPVAWLASWKLRSPPTQ